mmetsp:Transcript_16151/g.51526  ORF Transcript_16151/g.51526 Transcript_16151/m.51526 type:complete len:259 (+) Transcript_16151:614-1390(+)
MAVTAADAPSPTRRAYVMAARGRGSHCTSSAPVKHGSRDAAGEDGVNTPVPTSMAAPPVTDAHTTGIAPPAAEATNRASAGASGPRWDEEAIGGGQALPRAPAECATARLPPRPEAPAASAGSAWSSQSPHGRPPPSSSSSSSPSSSDQPPPPAAATASFPPCEMHSAVPSTAPLPQPPASHRRPPPCRMQSWPSPPEAAARLQPACRQRLPPPCDKQNGLPESGADLTHPWCAQRWPPPCAVHSCSLPARALLMQPG